MDYSDVIAQRIPVSDRQHFLTVNSAFPSIGHKIKLFWGHPEFTRLMLDLQLDTSDRPRLGFPEEVLLALHQLELEHDSEFPQLRRDIPSFWQGL